MLLIETARDESRGASTFRSVELGEVVIVPGTGLHPLGAVLKVQDSLYHQSIGQEGSGSV